MEIKLEVEARFLCAHKTRISTETTSVKMIVFTTPSSSHRNINDKKTPILSRRYVCQVMPQLQFAPGQPRSQGLFPGQGKGPGNEVGSMKPGMKETKSYGAS